MKIWPAAVILSLSVFVSIEIGLVRLAARGFEGPDDVNYYKMGLEYSRELERQKVQRDNGWRLEVLQRAPLRCRLLSRDGSVLQGQLQVAFKRPATRSQDQRLDAGFADGVYSAEWQPAAGPWLVDFQFARDGQVFRARQRWSLK
ncbi:MAG: FixH family protein [Candidatus Eremiobacteraeota bacterium]|nr:FixH family protein [Candidatus Eremiobacteraeota bacterium]